jgi:hypothetical protein
LFAGVDEFPSELVAENDIIGASTPFLFGAHIPDDDEERGRKREREMNKWTRVINCAALTHCLTSETDSDLLACGGSF